MEWVTTPWSTVGLLAVKAVVSYDNLRSAEITIEDLAEQLRAADVTTRCGLW